MLHHTGRWYREIMIGTDSSSEALMNPNSTMPAATVNLSARSTAVSQEIQETTAFDELSPCPSNSLGDPIPSNMTDATTVRFRTQKRLM